MNRKSQLRESFVGNRLEMVKALRFAAEGKVKAAVELKRLTTINEVPARLEQGKVVSRVVIDFTLGG